jgi:hypothetical protein
VALVNVLLSKRSQAGPLMATLIIMPIWIKARMRRRKLSLSIEQVGDQIEGALRFLKAALLIGQHSFQIHELAKMVGIVVCNQYCFP